MLKKIVTDSASVTSSIKVANSIKNPPNAGSDASKFSPTLWNMSVTTFSWSRNIPRPGLSAKVINPPIILPRRLKSFVPFTAASAKKSFRGRPSISVIFLNLPVTSFR